VGLPAAIKLIPCEMSGYLGIGRIIWIKKLDPGNARIP
jgi:hypothetical protein